MSVVSPIPVRAVRGYTTPDWLRRDLKRLSKTRLSVVLVVLVIDHVLILLCGVAGVLLLSRGVHALFVYPPLAILAARSMRGLECLVHEASHSNWTRTKLSGARTGRSKVNDRLADALAAWPVLSEVDQYALTHIPHHLALGSLADTDLARWRELRINELDRSKKGAFLLGLALRLRPYLTGWWQAIGVRRRTIRRQALWHCGWLVAVALVTSPSRSLAIWVFAWLLPFLAVLPLLRFLGELEEHDYTDPLTVLTGTYTNLGFWQRALLHPHNDGYHTAHHLFPTVPFFRIGRLHRLLVERDPENFGRRVRVRRGIFSTDTPMRKTVQLRPVTTDNWRACIALRVGDNQEDLICSNVESLAEVAATANAEALAIYASDALVGLAVLIRSPSGVELHRFMIDHAHQRQGYGRTALEVILSHIAANGGPQRVVVKFLHWNAVAERLYASLGFVDTGQTEGNERVFVLGPQAASTTA